MKPRAVPRVFDVHPEPMKATTTMHRVTVTLRRHRITRVLVSAERLAGTLAILRARFPLFTIVAEEV